MTVHALKLFDKTIIDRIKDVKFIYIDHPENVMQTFQSIQVLRGFKLGHYILFMVSNLVL